MRCGEDVDGNPFSRCGVYREHFDRLTKRLESMGAVNANMTRRILQLDSPADSVTGWYTKSFPTETVKGVLAPRSSTSIMATAGTYARTDYIFFTADPFIFGDELEDPSDGKFYEIKAVRPNKFGDDFSHYELDLTELPLHRLSYTNLTPTVQDARQRTKVFWDTYIRLAPSVDATSAVTNVNLNNHPFLVCYADPDYPLSRVIATKGKDIVFAVDQPTSMPMMDPVTKAAYGYEESVPTHVLTLDTQLQWIAEAELRRIVENNPTGSVRGLERRRATIHQLGSTPLYDTEFILNYQRGTT